MSVIVRFTFLRLLLLVVSGSVIATAHAQSEAPAAGQPAAPCSSEDHQAFDFWVGEWRVTLADGTHAGDNTISKIQGGCVVLENWRSATSAYTGTSYNAFNRQSGQWEQLWLDNQGGRLHLTGQRNGAQMTLASKPVANAEGKAATNRITWTSNDDGTVRQRWVVVTEGTDDQVLFDGLYSPVAAPASNTD